jgi:anti-sigma factor RsiW
MTTDFAAQERLSEYLDGELSGDELIRMEAALEAEPALRAELDELHQLVGDLGSLPTASAPAGLLAAVLAETAGLAIGVDVDPDLSAESGQFAPPPSIAAAANVAFWKAPWFGAIAAMVLLGAGVVFTMKGQSPPLSGPPSPVAFDRAAEGAMPSPSGALSDEVGGDAIVDADLGAEAEEAARERLADRLAGESVREPLMETATPRVMNGVTGPAEARTPAARPTPRRQRNPVSVVGPEGVFEAEWESQAEDGVVMEEVPEEEAEPMPGQAMPLATFAPDPVGLGDDGDAAASLDDVTMADEPLEDYLDPAVDVDVAGADDRRPESAPAATGAARRGSSRRMADASASKKGGGAPPSLDEVTFTGVGGDGTLRLAPGVTAEMAIIALRGNGVTVDVISISSTRRVLQLTVAESGAVTMTTVLRQHGALRYGRAPQASEGRVSLRLTMRSAE